MATSKRILFLNNSIGYVVTDNGKLSVTTNGGKSFVQAHQSEWDRIEDMASVDPNHVYLGGTKLPPTPRNDCPYTTLPSASYEYQPANIISLLPSDQSNIVSYDIWGNHIDLVTTGSGDFVLHLQLEVRPINACGLNMVISGANVDHIADGNTAYDANFTINDGKVTAHDGPGGFTNAGYDSNFDVVTSVDASWPANRRNVYLDGTSDVNVAISLCWIIGPGVPPPSSPYYIDYELGDDSTGDGSSDAPYKTLSKALGVISDNDTILVRGDGSENTIYYERNLSSGLSGITISPDTGASPVFSTSDKYITWSKTTGRTNVYEISYTLTAVVGCWNGSDLLTKVNSLGSCDSTINSYYFYDAGDKLYVNIGGGAPTQINVTRNTNPLVTFSGDDLTLDGDIVIQWASQGLEFNGVRNELSDWMLRYMKGANTNSTAIKITGQTNITNLSINHQTMVGIRATDTSSDCIIDTCTVSTAISNANGECIFFEGGTGHQVLDCILTGGHEASLRVRSATVYVEGTFGVDFGRMGFYADNGSTVTAYRCLAFLTYNTNTIECYGFVADEDTLPANLTCDHCVVANLERNTRPPVYPACGYGHNSSGTMTITNSIAYNSYRGIGSTGSFPSGVLDESYNCVYDNAAGNFFGITADVTDIIVDPLFVDNSANDYHLQALSPCIDAGTPAGADIGAYEYS